MLKNMPIKKKLILTFVLIPVVASISGVTSVFITSNVRDEYSYAMKNYGFAQGDVGKLLSCFGSINVSVHDSIAYTNLTDQQAAQATFDQQCAKMDAYFANLEATIHLEATRAKYDAAKAAWDAYLPLARQLMQEGASNNVAVVQRVQEKLVSQLDPLYNTIYNSLADVMSDKVNNGNDLEAQLQRSINRSIMFVMLMIAVSLVISLVMGTVISRGIANPIADCARRLRDLAHGDLKSPVPSFHGRDEIGVLASSTEEIVNGLTTIIKDEEYLLGEMAKGNFDVYSTAADRYVGDFGAVIGAIRTINFHLSDTLTQINQSSEMVSSGSDQVSSAAQNLSQGATRQASSIQELASSITEISGQVRQNAENAGQASAKAEFVGSEMAESNAKMQRMMKAMDEISESSSEIGKIIKTIEDIAFQTNILALNAAVEAARAGAAGKGFAVVADEVRNLASKSAEASKNTAALIEASIRAVENGTQIAGETAKSLLTAVDGVKEVVSIIEEISEASAEQSRSVEMVTQSVEMISDVVQTNSATSEESAAASEELSGQAQMLKDLVGRFTLKSREDMGGAYQAAPGAQQPPAPIALAAGRY